MQQFNMKQKEEYKETELGLMPKSWKIKNFEECINKEKTKVGKINKQEFKNFGKHPIIDQGQSLIAGYWDKEDDVYQGDLPVIIFGDHTRILKYIEFPFVCGADGTKVIVSNLDVVNPKFFYYALKSIEIPSRGYNRHYSLLKEKKIACPPITEQKKISYVLSTIQEAKEKTENVINSLKELKKSIMKHLFTYGPVSLEKAEKVKLKETEIGMVPEGWDIIPLKEITYFKNGINFEAEQKGDKGILTIDVLNMYGPEISVHLHKLYRVNKEIKKDYLLQDNDILFVRSSLKREGVGWTTLFKKINEPVTYCGFLIRARLNNEDFDAEYLTNYLRTNIARGNLVSSSGKVAITNINQGMLGNIEVPKPNKDIQLQISSILSIMDLKIRAEENKKRTLEELFKSMLHNLMTAKIRVNNLEI